MPGPGEGMPGKLIGLGVAVATAAYVCYRRTRESLTVVSEALSEYMVAFAPERQAEHFLTYYTIGADKSITETHYTRGEFYELALKAVSVLSASGLGPGDCHTHFFSCNTLGDVAFRLASAMMGTTPVTINWQADTPDRVLYKVELTRSRLVLIDDETPPDVVGQIKGKMPHVVVFNVALLPEHSHAEAATAISAAADTARDHTRIIIFTSGTTGNPKGVKLAYRSYTCNRLTFESFLDAGDGKRLLCVVVNPLHHTNSTAVTDWAMRKPGAEIHLVQRYTTQYWSVLARAGTGVPVNAPIADAQLARCIDRRQVDGGTVIVAPLVSRHFDFLDALFSGGGLPLPAALLTSALRQTILLLGSAPVGPTTVERLRKYAGKLPTVRFGSTETCLQVMGTPVYRSEEERFEAFSAGWSHEYGGQPQVGYYIGRPHPPYTECRVVRSVERSDANFLIDCADGEPGQLITRGDNIMSGYVGNDAATAKAIVDGGWYTNLGDVVFRLRSAADNEYDYYWQSRDSALLIRGGANYAYEQINHELKGFLTKTYGLSDDSLDVAVIGLRHDSEHEDSCCLTVELLTATAMAKRKEMERSLLKQAKASVSKGAKPDYLRFGALPRNFKGAVKMPELKEDWAKELAARAAAR